MKLEVGIACGECDTFSPLGTASCKHCGNTLFSAIARSGPRLPPPLSLVLKSNARRLRRS